MPQLLAFCATFVFGFLSSWVHGWALAKLWGWFIVKTFPSLPAITTFQAVGISLVVSVFFSGIYMTLGNLRTAVVGKDNDSFTETMMKAVGNSFASMLLSLISVGIGWIWLQIM